jgi:hypothetical protein
VERSDGKRVVVVGVLDSMEADTEGFAVALVVQGEALMALRSEEC